MGHQSFIDKIISQIKGKINQIALNRMTANVYLDSEKVLDEMKSYGYDNLSEYARSKFI